MRCGSFGWYSFDFSIVFSSIHDLNPNISAWGSGQNWKKNLKIWSIPSPTPFLAALVALYLPVWVTESWSIIQRYRRSNELFLNRWPPPLTHLGFFCHFFGKPDLGLSTSARKYQVHSCIRLTSDYYLFFLFIVEQDTGTSVNLKNILLIFDLSFDSESTSSTLDPPPLKPTASIKLDFGQLWQIQSVSTMLTKIEQLWPNLSILTNFVKFDKISQLSLDFTMVWFLQKKPSNLDNWYNLFPTSKFKIWKSV